MAEPIRCPTKNALEIEHDGKQFGTYVATVPVGHTLEDVLAPEYFGRMQARGPTDKLLRALDMIDVRSEDGSWYVRLMVRGCLGNVDKVITMVVSGPAIAEEGILPAGWSMQYMGIDRKWTIFYRGVEKDAMFLTSDVARARIIELGGEPEQGDAPKRRGRPPRTATDTREAEAV